MIASFAVPAHSGMNCARLTSTPAIAPSPIAMPISAPAKLFATDQLAANELGSRPGSYHSATITPWRTITTACVFLPGWKA